MPKTTTRRTQAPSEKPRNTLLAKNRQRRHRLDLRLLRQIARVLLAEACPTNTFELAFYVTGAAEMTRLNETFLRHGGSTDVITFDYSAAAEYFGGRKPRSAAVQTRHQRRHLHGEIFICVDEARVQARRFRATWQSEVVRYVVHGLLHLLGYDDRRIRSQRIMKREEDRLLGALAKRFDFRKLGAS
jgi:probable rRNA maturation factor